MKNSGSLKSIMRHVTFGRVAAVIAVSAVIAVLVWQVSRSREANPPTLPVQTQAESKSEDIVRMLMPHGDWADVSQLDRVDRNAAIQGINQAQEHANNERAVGLSFLLAAMGHDYNTNRDKLLRELRDCDDKPVAFNCRSLIADYLMELSRRGDISLLPTLFDLADKADGHFAESLGGFYSDILAEKPKEFLKALEVRPRKDQRDICYAAGTEDGGGMNKERLSDLRTSLKGLMTAPDRFIAPVARRCLLGVEAANKEGVKRFEE